MMDYEPQPFVEYTDTGEIVTWGRMSVLAINNMTKLFGKNYMMVEGNDNYYIDVVNFELLPKMGSPAELDGMNIINVPQGSTIRIGTTTEVVDDGIAELDFNMPGVYIVKLKSPCHQSKEFTVNYEG